MSKMMKNRIRNGNMVTSSPFMRGGTARHCIRATCLVLALQLPREAAPFHVAPLPSCQPCPRALGLCMQDAQPQAPASAPRRSILRKAAAAGFGALAGVSAPDTAQAISKDAEWPLWPALPVAPFSRRKTLRREAGPKVWVFDQFLGVYYVHVPIRMTVVAMEAGGLFVYAPVAATRECLALLQPLIDEFGPVRFIVLPAVAVEHKVLAGPFARQFPDAEFYAVDQQYSFPIPLPNSFLGLPSWTRPLPPSSKGLSLPMFGGEFEFEVLSVNPGPVLPGREAYQVQKLIQ